MSFLSEFIGIGGGFAGIPGGGPIGAMLKRKTLTPGKMSTE